ncbi:sensor histidine kinase [Daejeonella oryzae]|uniref:sensor histidine kinase n=1 Tax=Daejeonella oryzae TaxID=1122943 RepID=UPI00040BF4A4|nr:ATP-binding protein [Daejeonella oryzae]
MSFELYSAPLLVFLLIRYLRRTLRADHLLPQWDHLFKKSLYIVVLLFILELIFPIKFITAWVWSAALLFMIWLTFTRQEFQLTRTVMVAVLPLILISFFEDFVKIFGEKFQDRVSNYSSSYLYPFAVIWLIAMLIVSHKQKKALDKERKRRAEEAERSRMMAQKKAELEQMVEERTAELTQQKKELQQTIDELHTTQTQLIQSEKMASLGELTAGIAHEIQNPLNFVNNFSEVSVELIDEMQKDLQNGQAEDAQSVAEDIRQNLIKISHHGKRADAIVKGMLQHSRSHSGQKEPTDINALADEYLRLSYHGLRAKDKSFNASMVTDFDHELGKVNVIPQDMGRVILNLFTNAFYSVKMKQNQQKEGYSPLVSVSTKRVNVPSKTGLNGTKHLVEIRVKDNGVGIPKKVLDKIYQPFFTTKPTGEGTGLGLSLSYEIIKAHQGELKVNTKEGEFAEFIILLPA